jgi:aspartyl-tRNA(Asn)/glutamyl-tRNA(Gln) amidotransferase subunit C
MSKQIDDKVTKKVADLIKINIPEEEIPNYTQQLNTVLEAADDVSELDTKGVEITSQTHGLKNVWREDEPEEGLDMSKYPNTQNWDGKYFVVKKVL